MLTVFLGGMAVGTLLGIALSTKARQMRRRLRRTVLRRIGGR